jgi:SSS family solute:Na+ symporter
MLAGMMGALASTLDTHLNWGASYLSHDVWARFVAPRALGREARPRELVRVARMANLGLLGGALAIVPRLESIQTAWHASLLLGAGLGVVLVLRWIWWRMTAMAELSAIVASMVLAPVAMVWIDDEPLRLLVVAGGATVIAICVARFGPGEDRQRLRAFYERAHPPGFWGPIAGEGAGAARARLGWGVLATVSGSLAVFAALVGVATWMIGSQGPTWVGSRAAWIAGNLVLAACAAPIAAVAGRRAAPHAREASTREGA